MAERRVIRLGPKRMDGAAQVDHITDPVELAYVLTELRTRANDQERYSDYLRGSAVADACVRERVIGFREAVVIRDVVDPSLRVTFDLGAAMHSWIQNSPDYFRATKVGVWRCLACGNVAFGRYRRRCPVCLTTGAVRYVEHSGRLRKPWRVSYHVDMFLTVGKGDTRVLDIKTINGPEFSSLAKARFKDEVQVAVYALALQHDRAFPVPVREDRGFVLYIPKVHTPKFPMKMFHVEIGPVHREFVERKLGEFTRGIEDPSFLPPPLDVCVARRFEVPQCPVSDRCKRLHLGE